VSTQPIPASDARPDIRGYSHANIVVTDIDAAHDFYIEKLGFEVLPRPDFGGFEGAWYRVGDLQLHLSVVKEMPDLKGGFPHLAVYVPRESFDATVEAQREDFGVPVKAAFCTDPDGNVVELTDVGPLS
jgi:catechol 2,3-dioxygenase-like lactoylglutathione lyase family enzyme